MTVANSYINNNENILFINHVSLSKKIERGALKSKRQSISLLNRFKTHNKKENANKNRGGRKKQKSCFPL